MIEFIKRLFKKRNKKTPEPVGRVLGVKKIGDGYSFHIEIYDEHKDKCLPYLVEKFNIYAI